MGYIFVFMQRHKFEAELRRLTLEMRQVPLGALAFVIRLTPRRDITGGRVIRQKAQKSNNRVADALREFPPL